VTRNQTIAEITRKLVGFYNPARIYLFGSVARGKVGPNSDLDFLVVVPDDTPEEQLGTGAAPGPCAGQVSPGILCCGERPISRNGPPWS
jgi:hypothetical protein